MKKLRKTEDKFFICEECGKLFLYECGLTCHIKKLHSEIKLYYDKWLKEDNDRCKICGEQTQFILSIKKYKNGCCKEHTNLYAQQCKKQTCFKKYGVEFALQSEEIKEKGKQTNFEKYGDKNYRNPEKNKQTCLKNWGVENSSQSKKIKKQKEETCLKNYGVKAGFADVEKRNKTYFEKTGYEHNSQNPEHKEKVKQTNLKKFGSISYTGTEAYKQSILNNFGVENVFQLESVKEKSKQTHLKNSGVENPMQNKNICEKAQKSALTLKRFRETDIWYQGSYELDFLEKYYPKFPDIQRGPSIKYTFNKTNKVYLPDFYIPSLNLIIECKSSYYAKRDKEIIEAKEKATIADGFNYVMIVDKNYTEFNSLTFISKSF